MSEGGEMPIFCIILHLIGYYTGTELKKIKANKVYREMETKFIEINLILECVTISQDMAHKLRFIPPLRENCQSFKEGSF